MNATRIRFHPTAFRHRIGAERARFVVRTCPCPLYPTDPGAGNRDLVLFLGADQFGVPLEVLAVELPDDQLLVIHAMKMPARYRDDYERVMECGRQ